MTPESWTKAFAYFDGAVTLDPEFADAYVGIGAVHAVGYYRGWGGGIERLDEAEAGYRKAIDLDPTLLQAYNGLIRVEYDRGNYEECLRLGRRVGEIGGGEVDSLLAQGAAFWVGGFPDRAIPLYQRVLELDPANQGARWDQVMTLAWAGRLEEVIDAGEQYFERFGLDEAEVHVWAGFANQLLGELDTAEVHYRRALQISGDEPSFFVHAFAGSLYHQQGLEPEAQAIWTDGLDLFARKLRIEPDNQRMRLSAALLRSLLGRYEEVMTEREVLEHGDGILGGLLSVIAFSRLGEFEAAIDQLAGDHRIGLYRVLESLLFELFSLKELTSLPAYKEYLLLADEAEAVLREKY